MQVLVAPLQKAASHVVLVLYIRPLAVWCLVQVQIAKVVSVLQILTDVPFESKFALRCLPSVWDNMYLAKLVDAPVSHKPQLYSTVLPYSSIDCERIEDVPAFTATHSTTLSPTAFHPSYRWTTAIRSSCKGAASR